MMLAVLFALVTSAPACAFAHPSPTPAAEQRPGYGVVESIARVSAAPAEESASAGASARGEPRISYLVRVKLDDGSVQIRQLKKRSVAAGERVLITNAGDILPE